MLNNFLPRFLTLLATIPALVEWEANQIEISSLANLFSSRYLIQSARMKIINILKKNKLVNLHVLIVSITRVFDIFFIYGRLTPYPGVTQIEK